MKLSQVLDSFYVIPLNCSVLVSYYDSYDLTVITWHDEESDEAVMQEFLDQDVLPLPAESRSTFAVTTCDGETVAFTALVDADPMELFE